MDILDFSEELKNFNHNGVSLNLDERMQLELELSKLSARIATDELQFWGKINGINNDYYIAVAIRFKDMYEFPSKQFYWALSTNFEFHEMPGLTDQHDAVINKESSYFLGDPAKVIVSSKPEGEDGEEEAAQEEPAEEGEDGEDKPKDSDESEPEEITVPKRDLTELDRLAMVVHAIENDCQIAPVGAYKMTPLHQVRRNEAFRGLDCCEARDLNNYQHFRNVQCPAKKAELDLPHAPFNARFLEPISADKPIGAWHVQNGNNGKLAHVRSLVWPGFTFYHGIGSNSFGSIYVGDGLKNLDIHFMV